MFEQEMFRGFGLYGCMAVAMLSWCGGAYAIYRGFQSLPDGLADLPFMSADPKLITGEGLKWRRRVYLAGLYFVSAAVLALMFYRA